jgi:hypothetical protein
MVIVLSYIPVIKVGDSEIEQDIKEKCKIKYCKIKSIFTGSSYILHGSVNAKYPERLDQQIKKKQKTKVGDEFTLHVLFR